MNPGASAFKGLINMIIKTELGDLDLPVKKLPIKKCAAKDCKTLVLALGVGIISEFCTKCDEELKDEVLIKIGRKNCLERTS